MFNGDGISRGGRDGNRAWSPPLVETLKKEVEPPRERETSPVPSGRIAVQPESPISHSLPIFPQQAAYPRPFPGTIPSLYQNFAFSRPESSGSKPTSTSVLSFSSTKSGLSSPTPGGRDSGPHYKFSPRNERERDDPFEAGTNGKPELGKVGRSPPVHRPSSEPYDSPRAKLAGSDTNSVGGVSPSQSRRFDEPERQRMKTEETSSERNRTFSGSFSEPRETLSRMSSHSNPTRAEAEGTFI